MNAHAIPYDPTNVEDAVSPTAKHTDASKLSLPVAWAVGLAVFFVGVAGSLGAVVSNVRDINTRMEMQERIDEAYQKLNDERMASIKANLDDIQRNIKLSQYEMQQFKSELSQRK